MGLHGGASSASTPSTSLVFGGTRARRDAGPKAKNQLLSLDDKMWLWAHPCYLCGRAPALGIDRIESAGDYTADNAASCCTQCNYMKKDFELEVFKAHVARVHHHTAHWVAA